MNDREILENIDDAIHNNGEKVSDQQVLDYIERLLSKREGK
jgi:hypothetical protein